MKFSGFEYFLLGLVAVVLLLIGLWLREEFILWQRNRHFRQQDKRAAALDLFRSDE